MTIDRRRNALCASMLIGLLTLAGCATPKQPQAKLLRLARAADASYRAGALTTAKRQYEALLEANPRYATAQVRLGVISYREGDRDAARRRFEAALWMDAKNEVATYNLAMLDLNQATQRLEQYLAIAPPAGRRERVLLLLQQLRHFEQD